MEGLTVRCEGSEGGAIFRSQASAKQGRTQVEQGCKRVLFRDS